VEYARSVIDHAPAMIVAGGGDGTVSAVSAVVAGTAIALGVLPLGTLNHFARDVGLPMDIESAVRVLASGRVIGVDVGEVNGRVFLNNSSIGLYPRLVHHWQRQQERLGRGKWHALLRAALTLLHRYPLMDVRVRTGNQEFNRRTPLVFVGNNAYAMSGLNIGRRARLDSGRLSVYIPRRAGRFGLFRIELRALFGRLDRALDFDLLQTPAVQIDTRRKYARVAVDGEAAGAVTPLDYRIRRGALRVVVPQSGAEAPESTPH
jgi:diacylglycerol kinase family enzyme